MSTSQSIPTFKELATLALQLVTPSFSVLLEKTRPGKELSLAVCIVHDDGNIHSDAYFKCFEKHRQFAEQKACLSSKHKTSTRELRDHEPTKLTQGDILYAGGVYAHGFAVGVSGLPEHIDEALAWSILSMIIGLNRQKLQEARKADEQLCHLP